MLRQYLIDYSLDVIDGEVVSCKKHKWACMRFLRDIEREGTEEFPYIFDEDRAMRFFRWMNLFRHSKGVLRGQRIEPHEIQYFVFGNIYGWIHMETEYRRFNKGYWQVARKNAKSQSNACVATYEASAFGEAMSEVYCAATKRDQAKIVWNEADYMIQKCPELKGKFKTAYGIIKHLKSNSIIKPLSQEDKKKGDGLNPQCGIIDEYHAHETDEMYNVIDSGMIAREQPLIFIITTAGPNLNGPCYRTEYEFVSRLLDPNNPTEVDSYFAMVNELDKDDDGNLIDDIKDEKVWIKANPIACSYPVGIKNMRTLLKEALEKPEKMVDFMTKNMNVWMSHPKKKYMNMEKWAACGISKRRVLSPDETLPDVTGLTCFAGVDLSMKIDLSSVGFVVPLPSGSVYVAQHSFIPEETLEQKKRTDRVPYDLWIKQGWLTVIPGAVVDQSVIEKYLVEEEERRGWMMREICYDRYAATQFAQNMAARGYEIVEIRQGVQTLSEPIKDFRELVLQKRILHDDDPVLTWALGNAVTKSDDKENLLLDKAKSTNRIDPIAAVINGFVRARVAPSDSGDVEVWTF
ncbi:terminase large subunit [Paenibacillus mucilaginosus]|uniref:Terminase n=1 Tax=Paenibacillus mucilaginosus (strain KNP414) TaxID=1036673 RepID=F8FH77_PAEMK|nr:terminase TerL endonuclease subunit [Paenibacillus mucilaginosus]AEI39779.1 Terminase [Paenibacillus mucilaginosus KNP414]MCG7217366.1 terminase large subunit [Paenibacillus mucilaginosus]WDM29064.1 terminase large subunit [Paenibacillus mucilaginosus]